jgi:acetyl-CoA/propionyl-CoA carboxylase, biotin carboxylase, biotin carboxyl carrier protein
MSALVEPVCAIQRRSAKREPDTAALARSKVTGERYGVFSKVLIANRGEIAVRVIRACRELGISTVAIYSDLDRDALHVRLADEAYALGGQTAAESYINADKVLDVIQRSGAQAVHPGYGFFSENSDFAERITAMGVAFIGPPPAAIDVMGDKISARLAAEKVGVSGVPGTTDLITDPSQVAAFGEEFGYPIAIKAAYGGGGRGMKVVHRPDEVAAALESAQRESLAYFGRDECYMERYLTKPRHVEVQVMADTHGNTVYLGTRDCSAQRRHQKLIEEAPAPGIPEEILTAMGEAAVAVAEGCDYVNAGTVEFLYQDGEFFYLEMNTRLQVEHPVTELVTDVDLVELQLRVASGEPLPFGQDDIRINGHAIECRINAEDPAEGQFLPSPGPIHKLHVPSGFGVRWDGGYESGDEISQFYDNLTGKLCVWGRDRDVAIARMIRALEEMEITGVATTIPADLAILRHPDFSAIEHSTKWVEEVLDLTGVRGNVAAPAEDGDADPKVRRDVDVEVNGKRFSVSMYVPESQLAAGGGGGGAAAPKPRPKRGASGGSAAVAGSGKIAMPMQGTIVKVLVEVGQTVAAGDPVVVLEAMKMENNVTSDVAGTVTEVKAEAGASVTAGQVVIVIDAGS